jgi:broad specificity phosphatase PhoE
MKTLYLAQHCQSQHHIHREARTWPDAKNGLTDLGRQQALRQAQHLREEIGERPRALYTSAMQRAVETAEFISREIGVAPQTVKDLHEYNGRFSMERIGNGEPWNVDMSNWSLFDWRPIPEAETWREFHARVSAAMDNLMRRHDGPEIGIFAVHGGTVSNMVLWWLGLPLDALPERTCFGASPGSLTVLQRNAQGRPVVQRFNDRAHLAGICSNGPDV